MGQMTVEQWYGTNKNRTDEEAEPKTKKRYRPALISRDSF